MSMSQAREGTFFGRLAKKRKERRSTGATVALPEEPAGYYTNDFAKQCLDINRGGRRYQGAAPWLPKAISYIGVIALRRHAQRQPA
jgi:hypothetical protein